MKRTLVVAAVLGAFGILGAAQCCPPPSEPPCFTAFWQREEICFDLVVPWWGWCCPCPPSPPMVLGWRVVNLAGELIYQETFPAPVAPGKWSWKQTDRGGNPVAPGYYKIVISTTAGEFENTVKIVARQDCCLCCFPFFFFWCFGVWSRPCPVSWCQPYVRLYRCPVCPPPCPAPCPCGVTIYLGRGDP